MKYIRLITQFWYLQKKSKNLTLLFVFFPLNNAMLFIYYKVAMVGSELVPLLGFWLLMYIPMILMIVFLRPIAYLQKQNREKKDV